MRLLCSRKLWLALAITWTLLILVLCWMPMRELGLNEDEGRLIVIPHLDKIVHGTMFTLFGLLWCLALGARKAWPLVMGAGIFMAVGTEFVQGLPFVGRDADLWDGLADTAGLILGTTAAVLVLPRLPWFKKPSFAG